jgi:SAM-dependent methyltransferase
LIEHDIEIDGHQINHYAPEFIKSNSEYMHQMSVQLNKETAVDVANGVIHVIVQKKCIFQCRDSHTEGGYYRDAEPEMDRQWNLLIEPFIRAADFSSVLELAPGHGRNSEKLSKLASEIYLVDVNQTCIDACKARFGDEKNGCKFHYNVTDGDSLPFIRDTSISFVYSFDSMVHFDKSVVRAYLVEFVRVMKPGATGFLHHSNYGAIKPNSDWAKNHGNRSDVSAKLFAQYCSELGLEVTDQRLHGLKEGRGLEGLDCVTVLRKP